MTPVKAMILAGGILDNSFKLHGENVVNKAFIDIKGRLMMEYVIDALRGASLVEEIVLLTHTEIVPEKIREFVTLVNSGENILETVINGLSYIPPDTLKVLLVMADLPLLTSEGVDDFLSRCNGRDGEYYYSILSQKDLEKGLPGFNHTYVKLKDGVFCGGGLILLDPGICNEYRLNLMNKMIQVRKNPLEMAKILGAKTLFKIVSGQATREDLEKRTSEVFKCKAISIITPYIEIGINIDKPEELDLIRSSG